MCRATFPQVCGLDGSIVAARSVNHMHECRCYYNAHSPIVQTGRISENLHIPPAWLPCPIAEAGAGPDRVVSEDYAKNADVVKTTRMQHAKDDHNWSTSCIIKPPVTLII